MRPRGSTLVSQVACVRLTRVALAGSCRALRAAAPIAAQEQGGPGPRRPRTLGSGALQLASCGVSIWRLRGARSKGRR